VEIYAFVPGADPVPEKAATRVDERFADPFRRMAGEKRF
jgi:hypothetical protein